MRRVSKGTLVAVFVAAALAAASALAEVAVPVEVPLSTPLPAPPDQEAEPPERLEDGRVLELDAGERWIFVDKSDRLMIVNAPGFREAFRVALGPDPVGPKEAQGDGRTPEGEYRVCHRITSDRFHRFLGLSYPGPDDAARAALAGLLQPIEVRAIARAFARGRRPPWNTRLGGNVGIHGWGRRSSIEPLHALGKDWTDGCVGVTNDEIERIYPHVLLGTRVVIVP